MSFRPHSPPRPVHYVRWGWDLDAYLHGENRYYDTLDGGAVKRPHALDVNEVDAAIRRPFFWAMMITMDVICETIRALIIGASVAHAIGSCSSTPSRLVRVVVSWTNG